MEVEIQLTLADYRAAQFVHIRPRPLFKWLGLGLLALVLLALVGMIRKWTVEGEGVIPVVGMLAGVTYFAVAFAVVLPRRASRIYQQQKTLHRPFGLTVEEQGLRTKTDFGETFLTWDMFHKWKEGKTLFLVYQSDVFFGCFPKRCFPCPEDIGQFRSILAGKLGPPEP